MKPRLFLATGALLVWHGACAAQSAPDWRLPDLRSSAIIWTSCPSGFVRESAMLRLGDRLHCGTMGVPVDHHHPDDGIIEVGLVRVTASDPTRRQGALFFNPGGPGQTPMNILPSLAQYWDDAYGDHPVHGSKKRLAEQFDLIAVVPRGLNGGTPFLCTSDAEATDFHDIVADRSPENIQAMDDYMRATAAACLANPLYPFINTEQTVYDMEVARRALGEPKLHFLGFSYGAWLGSWYAASFPEHVGRMVLDSGMDWTADWDTNITRSKIASQHRFDRLVGQPAANDNQRYGLGTNLMSVVARIGELAVPVRQAWGGFWKSPENLLGALAVSDWLRATPDMSLETLIARMQAHPFHRDHATNLAIRDEAIRYAWRLFPVSYQPEPFRFDTMSSVFSAVMCNDMPGSGDAAYHQARIATLAETLPATNGRGLEYHCAFWGGPHANRPPLSRVGGAGDILMVHASLDPVTPLQNGASVLASTTHTRLLVAEGIDDHGVFGFTDSACVEDTVGRYLLTGILPAGREYHCAATPATHGGPDGGFAHPGNAATLRSELSGLRSPFAPRTGDRP